MNIMKNILILKLSILAITLINAQDNIQLEKFQTFESYSNENYDHPLRPQFHFTSLKGWNNDPNGMVFYDGEYHLYFQHNPLDVVWGNMTWGHAVSKDMVHWKQLKHAILPYKDGTIFSGTAVVDHNNSLGKNTKENKAIVAFYTHAQNSKSNWFYQSAAYSLDNGRSFTLINEGNGIVQNQGFDRGERDPKVFWHEESKKWIMILWVKRGNDTFTGPDTGPGNVTKLGKVRFFESNDLVNWRKLFDFDRNWVYECMDMVELPVDGDKSNKKWLLYDASFDYEIGDFDGKSFTTDGKVGKGDLGKHYYAAQTFNNSPDDRVIIIGWLATRDKNIFIENKTSWNQQMSFPSKMELKTTKEGVKLFRTPIKEIERLYLKSYNFKNKSIKYLNNKMKSQEIDLVDVSFDFEKNKHQKLVFDIGGEKIKLENKKFIFQGIEVPVSDESKTNFRVLLDRSSIEIFFNNGEHVLSSYIDPNKKNKRIKIESENNNKLNCNLNIMKSAWIK